MLSGIIIIEHTLFIHFVLISFRYYSVRRDVEGHTEIVDVMHVHLVNTDLFAGVRQSKHEGILWIFDLFILNLFTCLL